MPAADFSHQNLSLLDAAHIYTALGFSVLPVYGDASWDRVKMATVEWKVYQRRKPTSYELDRWFSNTAYTALAIVCGAVSGGLLVLDFDDKDIFQRFSIKHPDLLQTRMVETNRGIHLYFRSPPHLRVASRKADGIDLQSEGCYVIAPPSIIQGYPYVVKRGGQATQLSALDITRIAAFFDGLTHRSPHQAQQEKHTPLPYDFKPTDSDLKGLYALLSHQGSRNEALFRVSLRARDTGWDREAVSNLLASVHAQNQPRGLVESYARRYQEGVRTIHSAFSRPARRAVVAEPTQLPNTIREALLQRKLAFALRTLEALRLKGVTPGKTFTENQAQELLAGIVGTHSIRQTLTAQLFDEGLLVESPSGHPQASNDAASMNSQNTISKCFEISVPESKKIQRGRPTRLYQMPNNIELAQKLNVKLAFTSDPLSVEDLKSATKTRQAVHREYIKRRPDFYPRRWLANRIGVSIRTEQRYNREIPILVQPSYTSKPIHWWNIGEVPEDIDLPGASLEDEAGRCYPARMSIAARLLREGKTITLKRRWFNFYSFGRALMPVPRPKNLPPTWEVFQKWTSQEAHSSFVLQPPVSVGPKHPQGDRTSRGNLPVGMSTQDKASALRPTLPSQKPKARKRSYRRAFGNPAQEHAAQRLYQCVNKCVSNKAKSISLACVRRLVDQYDAGLIEKGLKRIRWNQKLTNPVGFLISYLRAEAKASRR